MGRLGSSRHWGLRQGRRAACRLRLQRCGTSRAARGATLRRARSPSSARRAPSIVESESRCAKVVT
eukprot:8900943-Alexandrium_andersonii.AAC.1